MRITVIIMLVILGIYYTYISLWVKKFEVQLKTVSMVNVAIDKMGCEIQQGGFLVCSSPVDVTMAP